MSNNLKRMEKDLRALAKRCKNIKYTKGLLLTFLLMGMSTFSEGLISPGVKTAENTINQTRKELDTSIKGLHTAFRQAKRENNKLLKNANLELIQLMEQGDQVVKSPWSSWQFGMNYFYSNWRGVYKGRGDKKEKYPYEGIFERSTNSFERYTSPLSEQYKLLSTSSNPFSASSTARQGLNRGYGISSTIDYTEPLASAKAETAIIPRTIVKSSIPITLPVINAPVVPIININLRSPEPVELPTVTPPTILVTLPSPNTNPFSDYCFTCGNIRSHHSTAVFPHNAGGEILWGGYNPNTQAYTPEYGVNAGVNGNVNRPGSLTYLNNQNDTSAARTGFEYENAVFHAAGNVNGAGKSRNNHDGQIAIHTVWNGTLKNITGNLYGKAAFLSIETWWAGVNKFNNVKVNIQGDDNSIFYIYPATYERILFHNTHTGAPRQRGGFIGTVNADIASNNNIVYSALGAQGSFELDSKGTYKLEGNGNMVYAGLGYTANYQNLIGHNVNMTSYDGSTKTANIIDKYNTGMTPSLKMTTAPISYGDRNIILFFNNSKDLTNIARWSPLDTIGVDNWRKSGVGIYQGEILAKAIIGESLNINGGATQTANGNMTGGDAGAVEQNVGVFAISGQRAGITPSTDLGAPTIYNNDQIKSLQVNDVDIRFGKYSKNGIMFVSQNGTVLDVAKSTNTHRAGDNTLVPIKTTAIQDYITTGTDAVSAGAISHNDVANKAATGTIIAYSQGNWKLTNNPNMTAAAATLEGLSSEINIGTDVVLTGRYKNYGKDIATNKDIEVYPIAYVAKDKGKISIEKNTEAKGYKSIIAYAETEGNVITEGNIKAMDEWAANDADTQKYLYSNIGGYALSGGTILIKGNSEIKGIGALATGANSKIQLNGTTNKLYTGLYGGLIAQNNGTVEFKGGTIENKDITDDSHNNVTPFYAENNGIVRFTGATTIDMYDGILVSGTAADYTTNVTGTEKYQGMGNVTVELRKSGVNLGVFRDLNTTWAGNSSNSFLNDVKNIAKFNAINSNGFTYTTSLIGGTLAINADVNLSDTNDGYNYLNMEKKLVTLNAGKTITGNGTTFVGQGFSIGSNNTALTNQESGLFNDGTVNINGGTAANGIAGMNVSFGTAHNRMSGKVIVDNGAGIYGTNGSKLINDGNIEATSSGVGMMGTSTTSSPTNYGTDLAGSHANISGAKTVEIINNGEIKVAGNTAVGIYADNNKSGVTRDRVTIDNTGKITLNDGGVGILLKGTSGVGGTLNLTGTGSSDIKVGINGIGIYAENSEANLLSGYGIEVKEGGTGIYVTGNTALTNGFGPLELKYTGSGTGTAVGLVYNNLNAANNTNINIVNSTNTTGGIASIFADGGGTFTNNATINASTVNGFNIIGKGTDIVNGASGVLNIADSAAVTSPNIGMYVDTAANKATNNGTITAGNKSVGIYSYAAELGAGSTTTVGSEGIGIYSRGGNVDLLSGSNLNVGTAEGVGVYNDGNNQVITNRGNLNLADNSFGFVNVGTSNKINNHSNTTLKNNNVYIYSNDVNGNVVNYGNVVTNGHKNYGIYAAGISENFGMLDFTNGVGNVAMYASNGGTVINRLGGTINVGESGANPDTSSPIKTVYGVGLGGGYIKRDPITNEVILDSAGNPVVGDTGNVRNEGTINIKGTNSTGMYVVGVGSQGVNTGNINLEADGVTGIYADEGAIVTNSGNIRTTVAGLKDVKGVVLGRNAKLINTGKIELTNVKGDSVGLLLKGGIVENYGEIYASNGRHQEEFKQNDTDKSISPVNPKITISAPAGSPSATIRVNGQIVTPEVINTSMTGVPKEVSLSSIGMYINTSSVDYTVPIKNLGLLTSKADLIIGAEAAQATTSKHIEINDPNIINPYNKTIENNPGVREWNIYSGSLTWGATATLKDPSITGIPFQINKLYLSKIPYTNWAGKEATPVDVKDTYNFLDGLEQRYGVEGLGTREKALFNKLNSIGNNEEILFYQATDEMMGHQYANVQQRINRTGTLLDKEFT
ncbi:autotransporter-associated N-terminal domain-containing protein, partial [Leptotrichia sp. OH3620_COT-345]|uniref:autotransporter-associated N-terminal domain-containing protein n=1 Tax=Leptotrichia sp. OH3620_COT-345 TaxID=2491048 RepID=UPI000F64C8B1